MTHDHWPPSQKWFDHYCITSGSTYNLANPRLDLVKWRSHPTFLPQSTPGPTSPHWQRYLSTRVGEQNTFITCVLRIWNVQTLWYLMLEQERALRCCVLENPWLWSSTNPSLATIRWDCLQSWFTSFQTLQTIPPDGCFISIRWSWQANLLKMATSSVETTLLR